MARSQFRTWLGLGVAALGVAAITLAVWLLFADQVRGAALRARLRETPPTGIAVAVAPASSTPRAPATHTPGPGVTDTSTATSQPSPSSPYTPRPTATRMPTPASAAVATQGAVVLPADTPTPAPSDTPEPTATPTDTPAPTATPTPEPVLPARLVFPDLGIDTKVVEMGWTEVQQARSGWVEWVVPKNEAGWHINSARLGERGNIVMSGHNNIYARVFGPISYAWDNTGREKIDAFTDRSHLLDGRLIQVYGTDGREVDYAVTAFYRVKDSGVSEAQRAANGRFMDATDHMQLTLITCWPPSSNTYRLIVVAEPVN
jgi:hypothetical protein